MVTVSQVPNTYKHRHCHDPLSLASLSSRPLRRRCTELCRLDMRSTSMYESIKEGKPLDVKAVMSKFDTLNVSPSPPPPYASRRALMGLRDAA